MLVRLHGRSFADITRGHTLTTNSLNPWLVQSFFPSSTMIPEQEVHISAGSRLHNSAFALVTVFFNSPCLLQREVS